MPERSSESWNFNVLLGQGTSVGSGYQLASARMVLPFLYMAAGAPVMFAGLLLPIVQVSKLISQIVATPFVSRSKRRKWYITLSFIAMAASLAIVAVAAKDARTEVLAVIFLLVAASLGICQGIYSLAYQDLLGRVLPPPRRGSLLYTQAALAGLIAIAIAWGSPRVMPHMDPLQSHIMLLWAGIGATVLAGVLIAIILEPPTTAEAKSADAEPVDSETNKGFFAELRDGFHTTIKEQWFRKFLVARALFLSIELAMPFYAIHAALAHAHKPGTLGIFVIASSIGMIISGPLWRWVSQVSVGTVMLSASIMAAAAGLAALIVDQWLHLEVSVVHGVVFLLVACAYQGVVNGRTVYLVGLAPEAQRPYFITVSNTLIGVLGVLVAFAFGAMAHLQDVTWPLWCLIGANVLAGLYTMRLTPDNPKVKKAAVEGKHLGHEAALREP